jgi:glycine dehydrogenase subunit 1
MKKNVVYPYIPNSVPEIKREMLKYVGARDEEQLYEEIPEKLRLRQPLHLPEPILDEFSIRRHTEEILGKNINCRKNSSFLGAGCTRHFTPAVCREIMSRGEFLTSYSSDAYGDHGKYQVLFEYQSLICMLTGMEFTTFPCHDGAQAAASALSMACRITGHKKVLVPRTMSPEILAAARNYLRPVHPEQRVRIETVGFDDGTGLLDLADLRAKIDLDTAAVYIENPSFLGMLEANAPEIGRLARASGAEFIVYADPLTLGVLEAPANYGATIAIGDLHPLGLPLSAGGAHAGFITVPDDMRYMSEMKDMVFGLVETEGKNEYGFTKNLFERTQFASRENAKEFTGTQSNFWAYPAAVYLSLLGPAGLEEIADTIMTNALYGAKRLSSIKGVSLRFSSPFFEEFVLDFGKTGKTVKEINRILLEKNIFGGLDLSRDFPELGQCALFCITEVHDRKQIDALADAVGAALR